MKMLGNVVAGAVLMASAGAGVGAAIEVGSNLAARHELLTIDTCASTYPGNTVVSQALLQCLQNGVPGGNAVKYDALKTGAPLSYIESVREREQADARFNPDYMIIGSVVGPIAGAAALLFFG